MDPPTSLQRKGERSRGAERRRPPALLRSLVLLAALLLPLGCGGAGAQDPGSDGSPEAIFLVRHAERAGPSAEDPGLTPPGSERAAELARLLSEVGIQRIHSTDTRRTRETASPLAEALGLEVELYDPGDLPALAVKLQAMAGRHLVVGHSNTTPELVRELGGEDHGPIQEASEYDRLYLLTPDADGKMSTFLFRFGPVPSRP